MRLFVAAWPSDEVVSALKEMPRPDLSDVRWTPEEQWHVTLRFLGDVDDPAPVAESLADHLAGKGARDATVAGQTSLLGDVLVAGVDGLASLSTLVCLATARFGDPPLPRPFEGHLTLARGCRRAPIGQDLVGLETAGGRPLSWVVDRVDLVSSDLGPPLAYESLATIELP